MVKKKQRDFQSPTLTQRTVETVYLRTLPYGVTDNIFKFMGYKDLLRLALANQQNYQMIYEYISKKYTNRVSTERAKNYGITYFQIHYSVNNKTCVHCDCGEKKRKIYYVNMIQTYICSRCMKEREQYRCIVKTQAKKEWYLDDNDLASLVSFQKKGMGYLMHLYFLVEIKEKAHEKHGGQQQFEDYREQRIEKYEKRREKVQENRNHKSDRELIVQKYYNQCSYKYIQLENITSIQRIKKYIKTNVPKNEQKREKVFEQVKEKLDKIEKYQDTQIKQQDEIIKQYGNCEPQRKELVIQLLSIYGLNLREDSRLCKMFIEDHPRLHKNLYEIVEIMRRKSFLHGQTLYPEYQEQDYYSWRSFLTEQQCEQKALEQWITNNQRDISGFPYTIQLEFLQYRDD